LYWTELNWTEMGTVTSPPQRILIYNRTHTTKKKPLTETQDADAEEIQESAESDFATAFQGI
jgi:hypothetical protein